MRTKIVRLAEIIVLAALGLAFAGGLSAQTTATEAVRKFEVISVEGNKLVVRDEKGTQELTVPEDFRFTVDGKKLAVSDLKPGMKGTATVTTKTTVVPVSVTDARDAEVLSASFASVALRLTNGEVRRFTRTELSARGITILKGGLPVKLGDLRKGDRITATIVTSAPPTILTEKDVKATLDEPQMPPGAPTAAPGASPPATAPAPAADPSKPAPAPATTADAPKPVPAAPAPASPQPAASSGIAMGWWVLLFLIIVVAAFYFVRKRT